MRLVLTRAASRERPRGRRKCLENSFARAHSNARDLRFRAPRRFVRSANTEASAWRRSLVHVLCFRRATASLATL